MRIALGSALVLVGIATAVYAALVVERLVIGGDDPALDSVQVLVSQIRTGYGAMAERVALVLVGAVGAILTAIGAVVAWSDVPEPGRQAAWQRRPERRRLRIAA